MPDRKVLIARRDWCQQAGVVFTPGGAAWTAALENVLDLNPQYVAEAPDSNPANTKFTVDLGDARHIGLISFAELRTTVNGLIHIVVSENVDLSSPTYEIIDSTWPKDSDIAGETAWGEFTLSGLYYSDTYVALGMPRFFIPANTILGRYILVEITDSADPALQIGHFGVWEVWEPSINFKYGWHIDFLDESLVDRIPSGSSFVTERRIRRRLNIGLQALPSSEIFRQGVDVIAAKGQSKPLVIVPDPNDLTSLEKTAIYGTINADAVISNPFFGRYELPLTIDQLV